jgi:small GTP-binding protein
MDAVDLKLVLLGNPGVGKTAIVCRYLYDNFGETTSTIGASFALRRIEAAGSTCNVGIWDTAGQERFDSLSSFYCRGARAALVVYDCTDRSSFDAVQSKWIRKVESEAEPGCHICIVGTKADLLRDGAAPVVSPEEVAALARKYGADAFETSALDGEGIAETFVSAVQRYHERQAQRAEQATTIGARARGRELRTHTSRRAAARAALQLTPPSASPPRAACVRASGVNLNRPPTPSRLYGCC